MTICFYLDVCSMCNDVYIPILWAPIPNVPMFFPYVNEMRNAMLIA